MSWNDYMCDGNEMCYTVICDCGAVYEIREDDGIPGCRDIEEVYCNFCGKQLARHFGDCDGQLIDDSNVDSRLKIAKIEKDAAISAYVKKNGYNWGTSEYHAILEKWRSTVSACLSATNEREV